MLMQNWGLSILNGLNNVICFNLLFVTFFVDLILIFNQRYPLIF